MTMDADLAWRSLCARIVSLWDIIAAGTIPEDPHTRAEGLRYLLRFLASGITICVAHDDTETPQLGRMVEDRMSWGLDNPDCLYSYTRVRPDAAYRIVGNRGSACHLELQVNSGHFGDGNFAGWRAVASCTGDDLDVAADGSFALTLGGDAPAGARNHLPLGPGASFLLVRQYFADWEHEVPADLVIERIGAPASPDPLTPATMEARLALLDQWLDAGARCWRDISAGLRAGPGGDVTPFLPPADAAGLKGQAYGMGGWHCAPGEALVLELDPPACRMWGVSLCDSYWQSIDFGDRQSSLNSAQAAAGPSNRVTLVVSHEDPGVANWLDPGGHTEGTLTVRYLRPQSVPPLRYRRIATRDLAGALGAGEPRIDPDARRAVLERRRRAVARRYRR